MAQPQAEPSMDEILASIRRIISEDDAPEATQQADEPAERLDTLDLRHAVDAEEDATSPEVEASEAVAEPLEEPAEDSVEAFFEEASTFDAPAENEVEAELEAAAEPEVVEVEPELEAVAASEPEAAVEEVVTEEVVAEAPEVEASEAEAVETPEIFEEPTAEAPILERVTINHAASIAAAAPVASAFAETNPVEEDSMLTKVTAEASASAFDALAENIRIADGEGQTLEAVVERMIEPMLKDWLDANLSRIVEEKVEDEVRRIARRR